MTRTRGPSSRARGVGGAGIRRRLRPARSAARHGGPGRPRAAPARSWSRWRSGGRLLEQPLEDRVDVLVGEHRDAERVRRSAGRRSSSQSTAAGVWAPSQTSSPRCSRRPGQVQARCVPRRAGRGRPPPPRRRAAEHLLRLLGDEVRVRVVRCDNYSGRMRYCQLLLRDLLARLAEHFRVLEVDVREQDDPGVDHVRRIQPAAEPGLDDGDVHLGCGELEQRRRGQRLELGGAERPPPPAARVRGRARVTSWRRPGSARPSHSRAATCTRRSSTLRARESAAIVLRRRRLAVRADDVDRREARCGSPSSRGVRASLEAELLRPGAERLDPGDAEPWR